MRRANEGIRSVISATEKIRCEINEIDLYEFGNIAHHHHHHHTMNLCMNLQIIQRRTWKRNEGKSVQILICEDNMDGTTYVRYAT
jgi:hypothetical protein